MKKAILAALAVAVSPPSFADQATCERIADRAEKDQTHFVPPEGYEVTGKGRLYFHSAPEQDCKTKDVFIIPGDKLIAYAEFKGWYSVMYINPKTNKNVDGWVEGKRLKFIGTEGPQD